MCAVIWFSLLLWGLWMATTPVHNSPPPWQSSPPHAQPLVLHFSRFQFDYSPAHHPHYYCRNMNHRLHSDAFRQTTVAAISHGTEPPWSSPPPSHQQPARHVSYHYPSLIQNVGRNSTLLREYMVTCPISNNILPESRRNPQHQTRKLGAFPPFPSTDTILPCTTYEKIWRAIILLQTILHNQQHQYQQYQQKQYNNHNSTQKRENITPIWLQHHVWAFLAHNLDSTSDLQQQQNNL